MIWAIIIFISLKSVAAQGADPDIPKKPKWFGDKDFLKVKGITSPIIIITIVCVVLILVVVFFIIWLRHVHAADLGVAPPVIAQGLDPQVVESFPVLTFPIDGEVGFDITDCHICLEEFLQGDNVRVLPACRHIYHIDCIQTWLTRDTQCPDCRYDYATWELESMPPDLP
ncbi:RING-H2 finger protein ATL80 [Camellia lanceoleosa]|uniref:RING-H2 finger protein ATL80 n=1 Tax=Camellia lanceoleosa TaxID=1840588 RepID=A0ACC0FL58_9ERIC|nr:RING-H2 finger protein ATL80 [Camellia lanceoleosa]